MIPIKTAMALLNMGYSQDDISALDNSPAADPTLAPAPAADPTPAPAPAADPTPAPAPAADPAPAQARTENETQTLLREILGMMRTNNINTNAQPPAQAMDATAALASILAPTPTK